MIFVGKAPYRVSLLGGGSDLDWFVKEKGFGICFGFALKEYSYSVLNILPKNARNGMIDYSTREIYDDINDIAHPLIREVLKDLKISQYIELKTFGFASGGSGLGGSSSFLLSLLSAISKGFKFNLSDKEIVEKACAIELLKLNKLIGKQDQYLCGNGGFNSFSFFADEKVKRNDISDAKLKTLSRLVDNFYLIPTNKTRNSNLILSEVKKEHGVLEKIQEIRSIAINFLNSNDQRDYKIEELFHESIRKSWNLKKSLSSVMSPILNDQYKTIDNLIPNNWIRLIGAGNGGYFLISSKLKEESIKNIFDQNGVKGIFKADISSEGVTSLEL